MYPVGAHKGRNGGYMQTRGKDTFNRNVKEIRNNTS